MVKLSTCLVVLSLLCAALPARAQRLIPPAVKIRKDRPRLLLRPKATPLAVSLERLRGGPRDGEFGKMLARLQESKSAASAAMVYLLTGDRKAAERSVAAMRAWKLREKRRADPFYVYYRLFETALAYDWMHGYEGFTPEIRAEVRRKAMAVAQAGYSSGDDHVFHNYIWMRNSGALLWALAAAGEDPEADRLLEKLAPRFERRLYAAMEHLDGATGEPLGYWSHHCLTPCVMTVLATQSAFETDLVGAIRNRHGNWLGRQLDGQVHSTLPDMRYVPWGDMQRGPNGGVTHEMAGTLDAMTWALRSPRGAWLGRWLAKKRGPARFWGVTGVFYFLYSRNLGVAPKKPPLAIMVGAKHGGHFLARSGWGDGDTVVAFRATDFYGSHNHFDQGSFMIYRNGPLAIDAGDYRKTRGPQQHTAKHNTLLFGGIPQRTLKHQSSNTLEGFRKRLSPGPRSLDTADMLFHASGPQWAAAAGRFDQAYPRDTAASCVRQLLFVRPGTVVILDRLKAPAGKQLPEVAWLLNVPGKPELSYRTILASNGESWLRCRGLRPKGVAPRVKPGDPTDMHPAIESRQTSRVSFVYPGAAQLVLVHVLEVGDGKPPAAPAKITLRQAERDGLAVSVAGDSYLFDGGAPYRISKPSRRGK